MWKNTDEQLARAAMGGDTGAFATLVQRLRVPLISYAAGLLRSREDAEEVAQEVFLAAWQHLAGLREPGRVRSWAFTLAHNLAAKRGKRARAIPLRTDLPADPPAPDQPALRLVAAVARLSEPHREVIYAKHYGGATTEQVAEQLGIPVGTVRSRLARAYAELRKILAHEESDELTGPT